jgi:hypothetical protein
MTPAQEMEMRRLTSSMWALLRYAGKMHPSDAEVFGGFMRSARILERRGFLVVVGKSKARSVRLTEAGLEAVGRGAKRASVHH